MAQTKLALMTRLYNMSANLTVEEAQLLVKHYPVAHNIPTLNGNSLELYAKNNKKQNILSAISILNQFRTRVNSGEFVVEMAVANNKEAILEW